MKRTIMAMAILLILGMNMSSCEPTSNVEELIIDHETTNPDPEPEVDDSDDEKAKPGSGRQFILEENNKFILEANKKYWY